MSDDDLEVTSVACDAPGSEHSHGYTVTEAGWRWFWVYDHRDEELSFRTHGYPSNHPYKLEGHVPNEVRVATDHWIDEGGIEAHRGEAA